MQLAHGIAQSMAQDMAQKALLNAAFVAMVMLAARLFGRQTAGLLTGLPIITTPVLVWVALEQGSFAATRVAVGSVAACSVAAMFCLSYDRMAQRAGPIGCLAVAAVAVGLACLAAREWFDGLFVACAAAALVCGAVLRWLPDSGALVLPRSVARRSTLNVTMAMAAVSSALCTPGQVDAFSIGLLTGLPIVAATVTVAEHAGTGPIAVRRFLRGYLAGLIGRAAFGVLFAVLLAPAGLVWSLLIASTVSAAVSAASAVGARRLGPLHRMPVVR